jgi:hypothetical protein
MSVVLMRLIPANDKHTIITGKSQIDVIPENLMTYRIPCLKKPAPLKLFFKYVDFKPH